jgi:hypothetical protein
MGKYLVSIMADLLPPDNFEDEGCLVLRLKGVPVGAEFVEEAAQRPNIAFFIIGFFLAKFWREVEGRADHGLRKLITGEHLGDAQVADLNLLVFIHEDVEGLDVPVQDLTLVDVLQSHADLDEQLPNALLFQRLFILKLEVVRQVARVAELHHDIQRVLLDEGFAVSDDEGVNELAHDGRLVDGLRGGMLTFFLAFSLSRPRLICLSTHTSFVALFSAL